MGSSQTEIILMVFKLSYFIEWAENDFFKEFLCGLAAGFVSVSVCHPLDVIRTRMNVMVSIHLHREGELSAIITISIPVSGEPSKPFGKGRGSGGFIEVSITSLRIFNHSNLHPFLQLHLLPYLQPREEIPKTELWTRNHHAGSVRFYLRWEYLEHTYQPHLGRFKDIQIMRTRYMVEVFHPPSERIEEMGLMTAYKRMIQKVSKL